MREPFSWRSRNDDWHAMQVYPSGPVSSLTISNSTLTGVERRPAPRFGALVDGAAGGVGCTDADLGAGPAGFAGAVPFASARAAGFSAGPLCAGGCRGDNRASTYSSGAAGSGTVPFCAGGRCGTDTASICSSGAADACTSLIGCIAAKPFARYSWRQNSGAGKARADGKAKSY
jgi:hypothetical protein